MIVLSPATNYTKPFIRAPHAVQISYRPIPRLSTLKNMFGKTRVSPIFDGRAFTPHALCARIRPYIGENTCLILPQPTTGERWEAEEIIKLGQDTELRDSEYAPDGYRPATHLELFHYIKVHPVQQLVALGSTAIYDGARYAAVHAGVEGKPALAHRYIREMARNGEFYLFIAL